MRGKLSKMISVLLSVALLAATIPSAFAEPPADIPDGKVVAEATSAYTTYGGDATITCHFYSNTHTNLVAGGFIAKWADGTMETPIQENAIKPAASSYMLAFSGVGAKERALYSGDYLVAITNVHPNDFGMSFALKHVTADPNFTVELREGDSAFGTYYDEIDHANIDMTNNVAHVYFYGNGAITSGDHGTTTVDGGLYTTDQFTDKSTGDVGATAKTGYVSTNADDKLTLTTVPDNGYAASVAVTGGTATRAAGDTWTVTPTAPTADTPEIDLNVQVTYVKVGGSGFVGTVDDVSPTDMIVTVSATGTQTVTNAEGQKLTISDGVVSGDMPVHGTYPNTATAADGSEQPELSIMVPASDSFTYDAESEDLTAAFLRSGLYASFVGTGDGPVTLDGNTLSVTGTVTNYKTYVSMECEEINSLSVSSATAEDLTVTSDEQGVHVSGNSGNTHVVTSYYDPAQTRYVTYTTSYPVLIYAVPGKTTGEIVIMADSDGDGEYDMTIGKNAFTPITSLAPYMDPNSTVPLESDPYDADSAGILILRGAWAKEGQYMMQATVDGTVATPRDVTWSIVDGSAASYGFSAPCIDISNPTVGNLTVLRPGVVKVQCTSSADLTKSFSFVVIVPGDYDRDGVITAIDADAEFGIFFDPDSLSTEPYAKELLDMDRDGEITPEDGDIMVAIASNSYHLRDR